MAIIRKDPLDLLNFLHVQMGTVLDFLSRREPGEGMGDHEFTPRIDVFETADSYHIEIDLPGFERRDISLQMYCNVLVVEGTKREEERSSDVRYTCLERNFGRFSRALEIPPLFEVAGIRARYERGVLFVTFPRLTENRIVIRDIPIE